MCLPNDRALNLRHFLLISVISGFNPDNSCLLTSPWPPTPQSRVYVLSSFLSSRGLNPGAYCGGVGGSPVPWHWQLSLWLIGDLTHPIWTFAFHICAHWPSVSFSECQCQDIQGTLVPVCKEPLSLQAFFNHFDILLGIQENFSSLIPPQTCVRVLGYSFRVLSAFEAPLYSGSLLSLSWDLSQERWALVGDT